jgi:hypothetical protein
LKADCEARHHIGNNNSWGGLESSCQSCCPDQRHALFKTCGNTCWQLVAIQDTANDKGFSPLNSGGLEGHPRVVELLLKAACNPEKNPKQQQQQQQQEQQQQEQQQQEQQQQ